MESTNIFVLPPEIILNIIAFVYPNGSRSSLFLPILLTCKQFCLLTTQVLYESPSITNSTSFGLLLRTIVNKRQLGDCVKQFTLKIQFVKPLDVWANSTVSSQLLRRFIERCQNLVKLVIRGIHPEWCDGMNDWKNTEKLREIDMNGFLHIKSISSLDSPRLTFLTMISILKLKSLKSLHLTALDISRKSFLDPISSSQFPNFVSNLKSINIHLVIVDKKIISPFWNFLSQYVKLHSINIGADWGFYNEPSTFPEFLKSQASSLRSLTLRRIEVNQLPTSFILDNIIHLFERLTYLSTDCHMISQEALNHLTGNLRYLNVCISLLEPQAFVVFVKKSNLLKVRIWPETAWSEVEIESVRDELIKQRIELEVAPYFSKG
jgi:hypothetical protein